MKSSKSKKKYYDAEGKCEICGFVQVDKHHWKSRGSGGSDEPYNVIDLCHKHHVEFHAIGALTFTSKYWQVKSWLIANGWEISSGKWLRLTK